MNLGVVIIDGPTVRSFVANLSHFQKSVDGAFASFDLNNDDVLSQLELRHAFELLRLIETHFGTDVATLPEDLTKLYDSIFEKFDYDNSGTVDHEEFRNDDKGILYRTSSLDHDTLGILCRTSTPYEVEEY